MPLSLLRPLRSLLFCLLVLCPLTRALSAATISFAGYDWEVRSGRSGPGPNNWDPENVWVDKGGALHLKLTQREGKWYAAELGTTNRLGFGRYEFQIVGRVDQLDENVVFGIFNYPTKDVGPDATMEIDIEFAKWGRPGGTNLNYTVWPTIPKTKQTSKRTPLVLNGEYSTHRFTWSKEEVAYQSLHGHRSDDKNLITEWTFRPEDPEQRIARKPMPMRFNLWLFRGQPPRDGKPVEVVIKSFKFEPEAKPSSQPK
jgi:hypothetical protein